MTKAQLMGPNGTELPTPARGSALDAASRRPPVSVTAAQTAVALTWVSRGYPVVPCSRKDKAALVAGFRRDSSPEAMRRFSDPETVRAWWSGRYARAHVGLLTGRAVDGRGLVVVDLDIRKSDSVLPEDLEDVASGADVLERLVADAGEEWPDTYTVLTPSGGVHLYYQQPVDGPLIGCATGAGATAPHLGPLIDVRGIGGYVIAAGSFSAAQGIVYRRISDAGLMPQPLPPWLLERMQPPAVEPVRVPAPRVQHLVSGTRAERAATAALNTSVERVETAPDGTGNRTLFGAARWLGELSSTAPAVLSETAVEQLLLAAAVAAGQPERPAARTIRSGWERGVRASGAGAA
ncbi:bifunctional DNA primase/polymerase [Streptomyces sp. NPDC001889]